MQTQDIMSTYVHTIVQNDTITDAAKKMREADVGCLVVTIDGAVKGIVTDRDLAIDCLSEGHDPQKCLVAQHMSTPVIIAEPTVDMLDAAHMMTEQRIRRLPVVDKGQIVGIVSLSDIAQALDAAARSMDKAMHDLLQGMGASRA